MLVTLNIGLTILLEAVQTKKNFGSRLSRQKNENKSKEKKT